jgi:acyl-CoA synthetase (NDP forming)
MVSEGTHALDTLFFPKNIAVVGVSSSAKNFRPDQGRNYIQGSMVQNFKGRIFPVHPKANDTLGFKTYARVSDIPDEVDLAIFTVPATAVLEVMKDCIAKKVKFVHLFTAGFSESGREDFTEVEKTLIKMARDAGIRVLGPNCMGIYCPEGGLAFQPHFPHAPGPTAFFSQSGQMAGNFVFKAMENKLAFSKVVSFGNSSDLSASDFLEYFLQDEATKYIGSYIEGLKDGRRFFEIAKEITRKKPLVIFKGGRTDGGSRAVKSHTAAIAGSYKLWESFCKQSGIISVTSINELVFTLSALQRLPLPTGKGVAVIGGAGGGSVTMTDVAEAEGLTVPRLSDHTLAELSKMVPPQGTSIQNPLDLGFSGMEETMFLKVAELLRDDPKIDAMIFLQPVGMMKRVGWGREGVDMIIRTTIRGQEVMKKPIIPVLEKDDNEGMDFALMAEERYLNAGLPTFPSFEMASRVVNNLADYQKYRSK